MPCWSSNSFSNSSGCIAFIIAHISSFCSSFNTSSLSSYLLNAYTVSPFILRQQLTFLLAKCWRILQSRWWMLLFDLSAWAFSSCSLLLTIQIMNQTFARWTFNFFAWFFRNRLSDRFEAGINQSLQLIESTRMAKSDTFDMKTNLVNGYNIKFAYTTKLSMYVYTLRYFHV